MVGRSPKWLALAGVVAVAAFAPASAFAHAILQSTEPLRGAVAKTEPKRVVFHFNEPVETVFSAVHVYASSGKQVDDGRVTHPDGRAADVAVGLRPGLDDGTFTATYRVISADGHPVSGGFVFSIGAPGAPPKLSVTDLAGKAAASRPIQYAFDVVRALQYAAIALALGGLGFVFGAWFGGLRSVAGGSPEWEAASTAFVRRARGILAGAVVLGLVSDAAGIALQGATAAGISVLSALRASVVRDVLQTDFGTIWGIRFLAWALLGALLVVAFARRQVAVLRPATLSATGLAMPRRFPNRATLLAGLVPVAFLGVSPALAGHAHTEDPVALSLPANAIHVIAMSAWVGGLAMLLFAVRAGTRQLELGDRSRLLAAVLLRFSFLAGIAIALVLASGITQSLILVRNFDNLFHTSYGHAVLVKLGLFCAIVGLGAFNRQLMVPRLRALAAAGTATGRTGRQLRQALRLEVLVAAAVLGATGVLAGLAPATARTKGPFATTSQLGPAQLQLTVDPARVGNNLVHLYLLNPRDGTQYDRVKELTLAWSLPEKDVGPLELTARRAGPGHYIVDNATLGLAGRWTLKLTARVSDFDAYYQSLSVRIR